MTATVERAQLCSKKKGSLSKFLAAHPLGSWPLAAKFGTPAWPLAHAVNTLPTPPWLPSPVITPWAPPSLPWATLPGTHWGKPDSHLLVETVDDLHSLYHHSDYSRHLVVLERRTQKNLTHQSQLVTENTSWTTTQSYTSSSLVEITHLGQAQCWHQLGPQALCPWCFDGLNRKHNSGLTTDIRRR